MAEARDRLLGIHVERLSPAAGIWANVSMIGSPSSRSGAISRSPSASSTMQAASIVSRGLSRRGSGMSGNGGGRRKRTTDVTSSPTVRVQSR